MPGPKQTEIATRLRLPETRKRAIATVIQALRKGRTVAGTAPLLDVGERTLKRLLHDDEGLRTAWEEERARWAADE